MLETRQKVVTCIKQQALPDNYDEILGKLYDAEKNDFPLQESLHWDYKREFPFSMSDDYFGGIVRLICAFHNTYGGIILFGVHDTTRTPGHNQVKINIERFNNVLRQKLSSPIETLHRNYLLGGDNDEKKALDILLVPQRPTGTPPVRQIEDIGQYRAGVIWMRVGHEVIEAQSKELSFLYGDRGDYGIGEEDPGAAIPHSLPPSPATVKDFIGRRSALDRLYQWLLTDDEPRTFLYGKGGAGKSTIAYEFGRIVSETCGRTKTKQGRPLDYVLFLGAKRRSLDPLSVCPERC
jgi:hypothetical protein